MPARTLSLKHLLLPLSLGMSLAVAGLCAGQTVPAKGDAGAGRESPPADFHDLNIHDLSIRDLSIRDREIHDLRPTLLLVSLDGFRWDYPERARVPNLERLAREGIHAVALIPSFPTKTFPNHYSIVTGLYPAHDGIIANNMWDPEFQATFTMNRREEVANGRWWEGEPIWVTAEKAGQKTGVLFWPGSEAEINGVRPSYWKPHLSSATHDERLATIFSWLDKPAAERPTFLTLYLQDVDDAGHDFGPGSPQVRAAVERVDATLGRLIAGLKARQIFDSINLIVVSDHGMAAASPERTIFLEDYIDPSTLEVVDWSPVLMASAKNGDSEAAYQKLKAMPHGAVYRKGELPARLHFSGHRRIPALIAIADEGWEFSTRARLAQRKKPEYGAHGYDNALPSMRGIFYARGSAFKRGQVVPAFSNLDIYPAMAFILGLKPAPHDGTFKTLQPFLRKNQKKMRRPARGASSRDKRLNGSYLAPPYLAPSYLAPSYLAPSYLAPPILIP